MSKNVRKGHRLHVNKTIAAIKVLVAEDAPVISEISGNRQSLCDKMDVLTKLDNEILGGLTDDKEIEKEIDISSDLQTAIKGAIFAADDKIEAIQQKNKQSSAATTTHRKTCIVRRGETPKIYYKAIQRRFGGMAEFLGLF